MLSKGLKIIFILLFISMYSCKNTTILSKNELTYNNSIKNQYIEVNKFYPIYKFFNRTYSTLNATVSIDEKKVILGIGESYNLSVKQKYSDGIIDKDVMWFSSDNNIVTVDKIGKITGLNEGKVTIKAVSNYQKDSWEQIEVIVDKLKSFNNKDNKIENKGKIYFEEFNGIEPNGQNIFPKLFRVSDFKELTPLLFPEDSSDGNRIILKRTSL